MKTDFYSEFYPWQVLDRLVGFDTQLGRLLDTRTRFRTGRYPRVNVWENTDGLILEAEVPGVDPAKIDVAVENNTLSIKGVRQDAQSGEAREFERSFALPYSVSTEAVKACCKNGILTITLARPPSANRRQIAVEAA